MRNREPSAYKDDKRYRKGIAPRNSQESEKATFAPPIKKEEARIDWSGSAKDIRNLIRGFNPSPAAFTTINGDNLKIFAASVGEGRTGAEPGEVISAGKNGLEIAAGSGSVIITELQPVGKKRMAAADYLRGHAISEGTVLGK